MAEKGDAKEDQVFLTAAAEIVAALDEVPSPTALLDEKGILRWQNNASLRLRGSRTGHHFVEFASPADVLEVTAVFEQVLAGGAPTEVFTRALDVEENYVRLRSRWNAIEVRGGTKVVVVLSLGDIREPEGSATSGLTGGLTPRQFEVLLLLDEGRSTAEIAVALTLSRTTVRNHVASLFAALGVHSRLQAVAVARAAGILDA